MMKNAMLKSVIAIVVGMMFSFTAFGQYTAKESKAIEKSKKLYNAKKYSKAISTIKQVQTAHYFDDDLWTLRCIYEYDQYQTQLYADFLAILKGSKKTTFKSTGYYNDLLSACYIATLFCGKQEFASAVLHEKLVQPSTDTAVSDDASDMYSKGGEDYSSENYKDAIRSYKKACDMDTTYYKATYKLGMCYYKQEDYASAIPYFQKAVRLEPNMLDPHLNLVQCFEKEKRWQDAYNACEDGIIAYPDVKYFSDMSDICDKLGKTFDRHWMSRSSLPNIITSTTQGPITDEPWSFYRSAKDKISDYCDDNGIITKSQTLTQQKYLEAYSWEFMLKKSDSQKDELGFAHKMMDAGFIDCYAMVSMFHITFLEQYQDFSKHNAARIRQYIDTYLVK